MCLCVRWCVCALSIPNIYLSSKFVFVKEVNSFAPSNLHLTLHQSDALPFAKVTTRVNPTNQQAAGTSDVIVAAMLTEGNVPAVHKQLTNFCSNVNGFRINIKCKRQHMPTSSFGYESG